MFGKVILGVVLVVLTTLSFFWLQFIAEGIPRASLLVFFNVLGQIILPLIVMIILGVAALITIFK